MVPSSPCGPCSSGSTTVIAPSASACSSRSGSMTVPAMSSASGSGVLSASEAITLSLRTQVPFFAIPIGTTLYLAGSAAASTCAAVTRDTSCSAETPP
ncbi:Uncharacterised protein [Mycobacteroides abscessus subsp. abscessus]|nr:Uncharacterised protein [Mycobacteroides abscessus subsp. abscessus]